MQSSQQKDEDKLCHSKLFMCNPREMVQDKKLQISALRSTLTQADVTGSTEQLRGLCMCLYSMAIFTYWHLLNDNCWPSPGPGGPE